MKKILALGGFGVLLALPVAASGESAAVMRGGDDYEISFEYRTFNDEPSELRRFRVEKLDLTCDGSVIIEARGRIPSIPINRRNKFRAALRRDGMVFRVKGRLTGDLSRVRGRARIRGDFDPAENCDSGIVRWGVSLAE